MRLSWLMGVTLALLMGLAEGAGAAQVVTEEFEVSGARPETRLYLRNKHSDEMYSVKPEKIVLFLHGASYPAHTSFDFPVEGKSWLDWMAEKGYDAYSLDLPGYGRSSRPASMKGAPEAAPPEMDSTQAVEELTHAVDFILSRRSASKLVLVGWSWGGTVAGLYAARTSDRVERLVLYAPQWLREVTPPSEAEIARVPAWRGVDPRNARDIWLKVVPEAKREAVLSKTVFAAWAKATSESDPEPAQPGTVRAPNGVVLDAMKYWAQGKPRWQPERISMPTLVIQGEWDAEAPPGMGMTVFGQLSHAPFKRYVMMAESTHAALLETNRRQLYQAVREFLETPLSP